MKIRNTSKANVPTGSDEGWLPALAVFLLPSRRLPAFWLFSNV